MIDRRLRLAATVLMAAGLGWASLSHAMVTVTHARNPGFALRIDGNDPVALLGNAQASLAAEPSRARARSAVAAARESIRGMPLNSPAFQLLGFAAQGFEPRAKVDQRVAFSARLSRRSIRTHLWLIEEAVRRNDVAGALDQYDIALRSSPSSRSLLFPVLTRALEEPAVRRRFLPYMKAPPPWLQPFLSTAITTSTNPKAIADLAREAGGFPAGAEYEPLNARVIRRLADVGDYASAVAFYRELGGDNDAVLASAEMSVASIDPRYSPITWQPYVIDGMDANFVNDTGEGVRLAADLESTFSGPVARKILSLSPGRYRIALTHETENPGPFSRVAWRIACAGSRPVRLFDESAVLEQTTVLRGEFSVTPACPVQLLSMDGTAGVETGSLRFTVGPVELTRVR